MPFDSLSSEEIPSAHALEPAMPLDGLLRAARVRIFRLAPREVDEGVAIVDIRSADARLRSGVVPGALHIPRTVLEWRVAPLGDWRTPYLTGGERLALLCDQGYSSSLAAATLVTLGVDAGEIVGGFEAWISEGLPIKPAGEPWGGLPGTGPPD